LGLFFGSFYELAGLELGSGADEGDQVGCVDRSPASLRGLDEFERHRQPSRSRARSLGDLASVPDRGESRLDGIRRAQMNPVLGGVVIEGEQLVEIVGDLRDRFGKLGPIGRREPAHGVEGMSFVLGIPDLRERLFRPRMRAVGQRPEHVRDLVELMPTSA
jgi:hypothetical protein